MAAEIRTVVVYGREGCLEGELRDANTDGNASMLVYMYQIH